MVQCKPFGLAIGCKRMSELTSDPRAFGRCGGSTRAPRRSAGLIAVLVLCASVAGCATRTYNPRARDEEPMRGAMEAPLRDLSLLRDAPPALLTEAAENPFRLPADADCQALIEEITALDAILGPDIDTPRDSEDDAFNATELLTGAVSGVWSLPYRSIVRRVTSAAQRDRTLRQAVLAGMVRRGFLKGAVERTGCPAPSQDAVPH